jgi:hypothetical protein
MNAQAEKTYTQTEVSQAIQTMMDALIPAQKEVVELRTALEKINALDYQVDSVELHEWAEAECFWKAKHIAELALNLHKLRAG